MVEQLSRVQSFGGTVEVYQHASLETKTPMRFSVFVPPQATTKKVPVLYWLSGLTCTEENFMAKAGAQQWAAEKGIMLVAPDTSPRGAGVPGESDSWDFGVGAGFYVNATEAAWSKNYRMYDYVVKELPSIVNERYNMLTEKVGIFGHSMGGHGALVIGFREEERYQSISAFAPIGAPSQCPWGEKAFTNYLGKNRETWKAYDASQLIGKVKNQRPVLVDQGRADKFLETQLMPQALQEAADAAGYPLELRIHDGYDHSYYFIATFIRDHLEHHAKFLL